MLCDILLQPRSSQKALKDDGSVLTVSSLQPLVEEAIQNPRFISIYTGKKKAAHTDTAS